MESFSAASLTFVPKSGPVFFVDSPDWEVLREQYSLESDHGLLHNTVRIARIILSRPQVSLVRQPLGRQRMLGVSRQILTRVLLLGLAYKITGEDSFVQRIRAEGDAASALPDWNPSHFLDTAEMSLAVATALCWMREELGADSVSAWKTALMRNALEPYLNGEPENSAWRSYKNNWVQVCHAGLTAAALCFTDTNPSLVSRVIATAIEDHQSVGHYYAPDGAYLEGTTYWAYGTTYSIILIDLLRRNLGSSFGIEGCAGFVESADYLRQMETPTGGLFCYSDAENVRHPRPALVWLARHCSNASDLEVELGRLTALYQDTREELPEVEWLSPFAILWSIGKMGKSQENEHRSLYWIGNGENPVACARTSWKDPQAAYFGIKGGAAGLPHGHMDAGSFIYENDGVRWAVDPGWHPYEKLEESGLNIWESLEGGARWTVFRIGPESHNILRFDSQPQRTSPACRELNQTPGKNEILFEIDLTPAYHGQAHKVVRSASFTKDGELEIVDRWQCLKSSNEPTVRFQWLTYADVTANSNTVILSQNDATLHLAVEAGGKFQIRVEDTEPLLLPAEDRNPGLKRMVVETQGRNLWIKIKTTLQNR